MGLGQVRANVVVRDVLRAGASSRQADVGRIAAQIAGEQEAEQEVGGFGGHPGIDAQTLNTLQRQVGAG